ncbi:hypothetical protein Tco_0003241 [Tanacetum coccineum]
MANVRVWLDKFCNNSTIFSLLRYLGTLPKSNRKLHCEAKINAITHKDAVTSRFGKDLRILLLLHPLFSTPSKEPIQNRGDVNGQKCKKPSSEKNIPAQDPFPSSFSDEDSDSNFQKIHRLNSLFLIITNGEFKLANLNPLFEENDKDVEIKSSSSFTLTSPEESKLEAYLERDSIPPGIDLTLPPTLEVSSSNPTSPTLTGEKVCSWKTPMFFSLIRFVWRMMTRIAIRKKIICLLATFLHKKNLSRPQEVDDIKMKDDKVSSQIPIDTIVMPIRITFDNPINFNDHFSKPKDLKTDFTVALDSTESSILPPPLLDSDSPFTAWCRMSVTLNSLGKGQSSIQTGLSYFSKNRHSCPPPEPPDVEKCLEPEAGTDISKITRKPSKTGKHGHEERKSTKEVGKSSQSQMVNSQSQH